MATMQTNLGIIGTAMKQPTTGVGLSGNWQQDGQPMLANAIPPQPNIGGAQMTGGKMESLPQNMQQLPMTPTLYQPPGIIGGAMGGIAHPAPTDTTGTSYGVDPATMTVQGQLKGLMDSGNPLMQQAQTQARDAAAARGLSNSTMAVTAGQDAMYRAATPIATSDAAVYGKSASENSANKTSLANSLTQANASIYGTDKGAEASKYSADLSSNTQQNIAKLQQDTSLTLNANNINSQEKISALDNQTKLLLTDKSISSQEKISALDNSTKILLSNNSISSQEKMNSLDNQTKLLLTDKSINSQEKISALDNSTKILLSNNSISSQEKMNSLDNSTRQIMSDNTLTMQDKWNTLDNTTKTMLADKALTSSEKIAGIQSSTQLAVAAMQRDAAASNNAAQIASSQSIANAQMESSRLVAQYGQLNQASSNATSLSVSHTGAMSTIMASTNFTTPEARNAALTAENTRYKQSMNVIGSLAGNLNLSQYL